MDTMYFVFCTMCGAKTELFMFAEEARNVWNQRAERTCENMEEIKGCSNFECSECGFSNYWSRDVSASDINYCPNCGAKVVC